MEEVTIQIKRVKGEIDSDIPLPQYMTDYSAGMDLYAAVEKDILIKLNDLYEMIDEEGDRPFTVKTLKEWICDDVIKRLNRALDLYISTSAPIPIDKEMVGELYGHMRFLISL